MTCNRITWKRMASKYVSSNRRFTIMFSRKRRVYDIVDLDTYNEREAKTLRKAKLLAKKMCKR